MKIEEIPVVFSCQQYDLIGIVHKPENIYENGVLLVVGGPQYRVGSHRQFVLLARMLGENGIPVMRFDYRGMGDSEGDVRSFADVDEDIESALETFYQHCPFLDGIVIWGLCDAASAALFYAYQDVRVKGLVLLNPWVFTEQGAAKTFLKYYYFQRFFSPQLWRKIFSFQFDYAQSLASLFSIAKSIIKPLSSQAKVAVDDLIDLVDSNLDLPVRMRECLHRFANPVLLILSGRDLTADEFRETVKSDPDWQKLLADIRITSIDILEADHTFSSAKWRDEVAELTLDWVKNLQ